MAYCYRTHFKVNIANLELVKIYPDIEQCMLADISSCDKGFTFNLAVHCFKAELYAWNIPIVGHLKVPQGTDYLQIYLQCLLLTSRIQRGHKMAPDICTLNNQTLK